jgi:hypothetical protein
MARRNGKVAVLVLREAVITHDLEKSSHVYDVVNRGAPYTVRLQRNVYTVYALYTVYTVQSTLQCTLREFRKTVLDTIDQIVHGLKYWVAGTEHSLYTLLCTVQ